MNFHIVTLFPKAFDSYLGESILKRAREDKKIRVLFYNPRDYAEDKWRRIDRPPYAGGPGMVIEALPVIRAVEAALRRAKKPKIIFLSPSGKQATNSYAETLTKKTKDVIIICGRYEGIDARVRKVFKTEEISVGPYVLTGGELGAMILIDLISRRLPGVLGNPDSLEERRVASKDVYTRPEVFKYKGKTYRAPKVLLSGDHARIEKWKGSRR
ncbi:MAG: tRNA (guanosine(37)-N1)-methyltransferase TrmD [Minisyncoccia bacterium]